MSKPDQPLDYERPAPDSVLKNSSEFLQLMQRRRTVRTFSSEPLPDGVLENIVQTAGTAPSGANKQPWFFTVVTSPEIKRRIRVAAEHEEALNYSSRYSAEMLADIGGLPVDASKPYLEEAPALIVVFKQSYRVDEEGYRRKNYYVNESVGIASGLLLAAIHQAGLVTVTHTPSPMKFMNDILERPHYESAILLMPVGYPAEGTTVPDLTRKSLDEIARFYAE
ncbi:MAG: Nitroreductase [Bacteroidetes bacterium HLUCCA01]|nr:MAG: Nitroreductase [Bacteroidetes bacterium HLUCCA01]